MKERLEQARKIIRPEWEELYTLRTYRQMKKEEPEKIKHIQHTKTIDLVKTFPNIEKKSLTEVISSRRSLRSYEDQHLTFEECSYVVWETARIDHFNQGRAYKTIPTAGATNSTETYVYIDKVVGIDPGIYLYEQDLHRLALVNQEKGIKEKVNQALLRQLRGAAMVVYFTHVLPRVEYKYAHVAAKLVCLEAGHACQNLSLVAESIDSGVCAIAAYNQADTDALLKIDGKEHFTIYCATLGKKKKERSKVK